MGLRLNASIYAFVLFYLNFGLFHLPNLGVDLTTSSESLRRKGGGDVGNVMFTTDMKERDVISNNKEQIFPSVLLLVSIA